MAAAAWMREFRALRWAEVSSVVGDQLAKIALTVLVYAQTQSVIWTALTYSMTLLPDLVAGPLLSGLADRYPRREVMIVSTAAQAGFVGLMTVPGLPLWAIGVLVALVAVAQAPFKAAQSSIVLDILRVQDNIAGQAQLSNIREIGQLAGLAGGAVVVAAVGTTTALVIDALSFVIAAVLIWAFVQRRPAAAPQDRLIGGWSLIWRDPLVRTHTWLYWLWGLAILPEAALIPLAAEIRAPTWALGLLMAADPLGFAVMTWVVGGSVSGSRRRPDARTQRALIGPLAVLVFAPLMGFALQPHPIVAGVLLFVSGAGASYLALSKGPLNELIPGSARGKVNGLYRTGLRASQGLIAASAGLIAHWLGAVTTAIAAAGLCGTVLAVFGAFRLRRLTTADGSTASAVAKW